LFPRKTVEDLIR
jgi:hypothetical protein